MDKNNNKDLYNAEWQITGAYGSMLYIPPSNYHLPAAKQEPYQKKSIS